MRFKTMKRLGFFTLLFTFFAVFTVNAFSVETVNLLQGKYLVENRTGTAGSEVSALAKSDPTRLHHAWTKYLGEAKKQYLVPLPKSVHDAYHSGLDKILPR